MKNHQNRIGQLSHVLFLLCFLVCGRGLASDLIYETTLPCLRFSVEEQPKLIQQAFKDFLTKVSGSEKILSNPLAIRAVNSVDTYVKQFSYHEDANKQRFLLVKFEPALMNELLETLGVNFQSDNEEELAQTNPLTAAWMVMATDPANPHWIGNESEQVLMQQMNTAAKQKGIPLLFPLLDLTDNAVISERHVLEKEWGPIQAASKRYDAKALWIGKITQQTNGWHAEWAFMRDATPIIWESSHANLEGLCQEGLAELGIRLAEEQGFQIAQKTTESFRLNEPKQMNRISLGVLGIKGIEQYTSVVEYLQKLPDVKQVEVDQISAEQTIFNIVTSNNPEHLSNEIRSGKMLVESQPGSAELKQDRLTYKLSEVL